MALQDTSSGGSFGAQLLPLDKPAHFEIDVEAALSSELAKPVYKAGATRYNAKVPRIPRLLWCPRLDLASGCLIMMHCAQQL